MTVRIDPKSLLIGVALAGVLVLVVGGRERTHKSAGGSLSFGLHQPTCVSGRHMTGQTWSSGRDYRRFSEPKLELKPVAIPAEAKGFVGRWVSADSDHDSLAVTLDADAICAATDDGDAHGRSWRVEGGRIFITIDDEAVTGQIDADGRPVLREEGDEADRIPFTRVQ